MKTQQKEILKKVALYMVTKNINNFEQLLSEMYWDSYTSVKADEGDTSHDTFWELNMRTR